MLQLAFGFLAAAPGRRCLVGPEGDYICLNEFMFVLIYINPPTRVGVTWKYLMQDPNDVG